MRAAAPRVLVGEGNGQQHQVDRNQRQARAPREFGEVVLGRVAQQFERRRAGGGRDVDHRLALDLHAVAFEFHDAEIRLARLAVVTAAVFEDDEAVAVLVRLGMAGLRHHHVDLAVFGAGHEHVLDARLVRRHLLDEEHPVAHGRFAELARREQRDLVALLEARADQLALLVRPRPADEHEEHDENDDGRRKHADRLDEARETHARGQPDHHFRVFVPARQDEQDRHEQGRDQHDGQIADHGQADQDQHVARIDFPGGGEADDPDHHRGQHEREENHEHGTSRVREFALEGAFKDHC